MKKGLRIYMRGHIATRPCNFCIRLSKNSATDHGDDRRKPHFGGLCVMLGKDGGCCACVGAGAPGCNAECRRPHVSFLSLYLLVATFANATYQIRPRCLRRRVRPRRQLCSPRQTTAALPPSRTLASVNATASLHRPSRTLLPCLTPSVK